MHHALFRATIPVLVSMASLGAETVDGPRHKLICGDYAGGQVCVIDEKGTITRTIKADNINDVWSLADGQILFAHRGGVRLYNPDGKLTFEWATPEKGDEIHTCQPLPDGNILLAQNARSRLLEVNLKGEIVKEIPVRSKRDDTHMRFRMCRKLPDGHYLCMISSDDEIRELDGAGKTVRVIRDLPGIQLSKAHAVVRLPNGNTLFSCGAGKMVVEVDPKDQVVWKIEDGDLPGITMTFVTGLTRRPNGNTVLTFYQGSHHLVEVTPDKKVVWKWRVPELKTVVSVQILDDAGDARKGEVLK